MNPTDIAWKLAYALLILAGGSLVGSWLSGVANLAFERARLDPMVRRLLVSLVRPAVFALAVFAALAQLGIPMTSFAAIAGAVTLAIGLALQGSLSNVASGAMLLTIRPFSVDDTVQVAGVVGKVRALQLFCTVLDTHDGKIITLPNDVVWKSPISTFSATRTSRIDLAYTLPPQADHQRAEAELLAAMGADARALQSPAPIVVWGDVGDLGVRMTGRLWVENGHVESAKSDIQRDVLGRFRAAGVSWCALQSGVAVASTR